MAMVGIKLIMTTVLVETAGMCPERAGAKECDCCEGREDDRAQSLLSAWPGFAVSVAMSSL